MAMLTIGINQQEARKFDQIAEFRSGATTILTNVNLRKLLIRLRPRSITTKMDW